MLTQFFMSIMPKNRCLNENYFQCPYIPHLKRAGFTDMLINTGLPYVSYERLFVILGSLSADIICRLYPDFIPYPIYRKLEDRSIDIKIELPEDAKVASYSSVIGSKVFVSNTGMPLEDGEHKLEDGMVLKVEKGTIIKIDDSNKKIPGDSWAALLVIVLTIIVYFLLTWK